MTPSTLYLTLVFGAAIPGNTDTSLYQVDQSFETVIRGQSPVGTTNVVTTPLGMEDPWRPRLAQYGAPVQDPFLQPPGGYGAGGYGAAPPGGAQPWWLQEAPPLYSGINGPQPFKFGWTSWLDATYIPDQGISPGTGEFGMFGLDIGANYTSQISPSTVLTHGPDAGWRSWKSPRLTSGERLPASAFHLGYNFETVTQTGSPWAIVFGFSPSINSDFEQSIGSEAVQLDAKVAGVYNAGPGLQYVVGALYWDRVDDIILPYGGLVFTPDDRSEYRLMFPESRFSYYVGRVGEDDKWLYVSAGYHVESYDIELSSGPTGPRGDQIQFSDWRVMFGLRSDNGLMGLGSYIEAGYVFDREVEFKGSTPDFDIDSGFILRGGLRY
ncbi:hypothetical protein [Thalassoroseus pseudoceratinae]|uniref:hypothetical protein n=1 Tax=Thalassoroseus pseudoceratinae TaxID=2713176 RepID=UPI00141ECFEE|nr:hypothetical protein [Thalassoroseus pseudoceratinae]